MKVLVTGGAGFIGSTIASALFDAGHEPVILDDLSAGLRVFGERFSFYEGDYGDRALVRRLLTEHPDIDAVVHCAAHIIVPESMAQPLRYYDNNVAKLPGFLATIIEESDCRRLVFSSTAALYEPDARLVVDEDSPIRPLSPYAASKSIAERILADTAVATGLAAISLRYFNPVGADPQLRSGLQHLHPSHALGRLFEAREQGVPFTVTGTDWPTRDGSGLRDYIHVWDLARAHVTALERFDEITSKAPAGRGLEVINLGTGTGTTVFELVAAFAEATGWEPNVRTAPPRPGDVIGCCASGEKAERLLDWRAECDLVQAIRDSLAWNEILPGLPRG